MAATLYLVVPCYKEEEVLPLTGPVFLQKIKDLIRNGAVSGDSRVLFVNDGSPDRTWDLICSLHNEDPLVSGIDLAENTGEKNALLAGMFYAVRYADCVVTIDCDLQDDLNAVDEMLEKYYEGNEIVFGVRNERSEDPLSERFFSKCFYLMMKLMRTGLQSQHSNFRLMSRQAVELLKNYENIPYFLPAVASTLPLQHTVVYHRRAARRAGRSKYNYKSKIELALSAVLVHSAVLPVLCWVFLGVCCAGTLAALIGLIAVCVSSGSFPGWLCVLTAVFFVGALLFAALGVFFARTKLFLSFARMKRPFRIREEKTAGPAAVK